MKCENCEIKNHVIDKLKKIIIATLYHEKGYDHDKSVKFIEKVLNDEYEDFINESLDLCKNKKSDK